MLLALYLQRGCAAAVVACQHASVDEQHLALEPRGDAFGSWDRVPHDESRRLVAVQQADNVGRAFVFSPCRLSAEPQRTLRVHGKPAADVQHTFDRRRGL